MDDTTTSTPTLTIRARPRRNPPIIKEDEAVQPLIQTTPSIVPSPVESSSLSHIKKEEVVIFDSNTTPSSNETIISSSTSTQKNQPKQKKQNVKKRNNTFSNQSIVVDYANKVLAAFDGSVLWHGQLCPNTNASYEDQHGMTKFLPYFRMMSPRAAIWFGTIPWEATTSVIFNMSLFIIILPIISYITGWYQLMSLPWFIYSAIPLLYHSKELIHIYNYYYGGGDAISVNVFRIIGLITLFMSIYNYNNIVLLAAVLSVEQVYYSIPLNRHSTDHEISFTSIPSKKPWWNDISYIPNMIVFTGLIVYQILRMTHMSNNTRLMCLLQILPFFLAFVFVLVYITLNRWLMIMDVRTSLLNIGPQPMSEALQHLFPTHMRNVFLGPKNEKFTRSLQAWIYYHLDLIALPQLATIHFPPLVMDRIQELTSPERLSLLQYISAQYVETGNINLGLLTKQECDLLKLDDQTMCRTASSYFPDIERTIIENHQNPLLRKPDNSIHQPWPINEPANILNPSASNMCDQAKGSSVGFTNVINKAVNRFINQYHWYVYICRLIDIKLDYNNERHSGSDKFELICKKMAEITAIGRPTLLNMVDDNVSSVMGIVQSFIDIPNTIDITLIVKQGIGNLFNMPLVRFWSHVNDIEKILSPKTNLVADFYPDHRSAP